MTVAAAFRFKHFKNATVLENLLEVVERLVVAKVDLTHNVLDPFALNVEGVVFAANGGHAVIRRRGDCLLLGRDLRRVDADGGELGKALGHIGKKRRDTLTRCGRNIEKRQAQRFLDKRFEIPHILLLFKPHSVTLISNDDLRALGKVGQEVTVTIDEGDDIQTISEKLQKVGMVRYPKLFTAFAELTGKGEGILVGTITFSDSTVYDYNALINAMSYRGGSSVTVQIMIPEGYNCAQIFALLEEKGVKPNFTDYPKNAQWLIEFRKEVYAQIMGA